MEDSASYSSSMTVNSNPHPVYFLFMIVMERNGKKVQKKFSSWMDKFSKRSDTGKKMPTSILD